MNKNIIRLTQQESATVLLEDYCRLTHSEEGEIELVVISENGEGTYIKFNQQGLIVEQRSRILDPSDSMDILKVTP